MKKIAMLSLLALGVLSFAAELRHHSTKQPETATLDVPPPDCAPDCPPTKQ